MRSLAFLVGASLIGCAAPSATRVTSTPTERVAWLRTETTRAVVMNDRMRGSYLPRATPGAAIVCSLAIQIDAWYGVMDERWELTRASVEPESMQVAPVGGIRADLARIGIRDCVLDMNR